MPADPMIGRDDARKILLISTPAIFVIGCLILRAILDAPWSWAVGIALVFAGLGFLSTLRALKRYQ
jgi:hypothetical protein